MNDFKKFKKFLDVVGNEIVEHFSSDDFDLDEGDIQVIECHEYSIILGLFERDENGETTDKEIGRVTVQVLPHI